MKRIFGIVVMLFYPNLTKIGAAIVLVFVFKAASADPY